jgi:hypothetical protein
MMDEPLWLDASLMINSGHPIEGKPMIIGFGRVGVNLKVDL